MIKFKKRRLVIISLAIIFALILYIVITAAGIWSYGNTDRKEKSDAVIVLGAATYNGEVSKVYKERINHGIWLLNNGYADYLILTGGVAKGNTVSDASVAKEYAISLGVTEEVIFTEEKSTITEENIKFSKEIMDENSLETAIIVSDPLHMKRAMLMAKDYGVRGVSSPTPTTRYISLKTKLPFLARELVLYAGYSVVRILKLVRVA